jgi:hypothetical protein
MYRCVMVDLVEIQAAYYMVAATGVLVAAAYYVMNIRTNQKNQELILKSQEQSVETRQLQIFMNIYQTIMSKEFQRDSEEILHKWEWTDTDDYLQKYGNHLDEHTIAAYVMRTYDGVGTLIRKGLVNPELVYDLTYVMVLEMWEKFEAVLCETRRRFNAPQVYVDFEYLYGILAEIRAKRGYPKTDLKAQYRVS